MPDIITQVNEDNFTVTKTVTENISLSDLKGQIDVLNSKKVGTAQARDAYFDGCNKSISAFDDEIKIIQARIDAAMAVAVVP